MNKTACQITTPGPGVAVTDVERVTHEATGHPGEVLHRQRQTPAPAPLVLPG